MPCPNRSRPARIVPIAFLITPKAQLASLGQRKPRDRPQESPSFPRKRESISIEALGFPLSPCFRGNDGEWRAEGDHSPELQSAIRTAFAAGTMQSHRALRRDGRPRRRLPPARRARGRHPPHRPPSPRRTIPSMPPAGAGSASSTIRRAVSVPPPGVIHVRSASWERGRGVRAPGAVRRLLIYRV